MILSNFSTFKPLQPLYFVKDKSVILVETMQLIFNQLFNESIDIFWSYLDAFGTQTSCFKLAMSFSLNLMEYQYVATACLGVCMYYPSF